MIDFILNPGSKDDKTSIDLATRTGNFIPNERRHEYPPAKLQESIKMFAETNPKAILRSVTAVYNCIGLVFSSRRTWIDTQYVRKILYEDSYRQIANLSEINVGDLVIYTKDKQINHIGIIIKIEKNIMHASFKYTVMSKWGPFGEYLHDIDDVPTSFGPSKEFWTDRKLV
ncbi:MAG: NlpC/P60 family protein [Candidatus Thorarchaeota archaeon]